VRNSEVLSPNRSHWARLIAGGMPFRATAVGCLRDEEDRIREAPDGHTADVLVLRGKHRGCSAARSTAASTSSRNGVPSPTRRSSFQRAASSTTVKSGGGKPRYDSKLAAHGDPGRVAPCRNCRRGGRNEGNAEDRRFTMAIRSFRELVYSSIRLTCEISSRRIYTEQQLISAQLAEIFHTCG
jgi:hypothetical protein